MQPVVVQQVVQPVIRPPDMIVFVVQVMAIAAVADTVRISAITVFMMFPVSWFRHLGFYVRFKLKLIKQTRPKFKRSNLFWKEVQ